MHSFTDKEEMDPAGVSEIAGTNPGIWIAEGHLLGIELTRLESTSHRDQRGQGYRRCCLQRAKKVLTGMDMHAYGVCTARSQLHRFWL